MPDRVFIGDALLIRGAGRTDFQNGDPRLAYQSIFGRLPPQSPGGICANAQSAKSTASSPARSVPLRRLAGKSAPRRVAGRAGEIVRTPDRVLLRLRRALGDGCPGRRTRRGCTRSDMFMAESMRGRRRAAPCRTTRKCQARAARPPIPTPQPRWPVCRPQSVYWPFPAIGWPRKPAWRPRGLTISPPT